MEVDVGRPAATFEHELASKDMILAHTRRTGEDASARLHERSRFFAQLSANCFSSCSCLLDRIFKHQFSDLMFDGDCRRKFDFSSEPVCAHWAFLYMGMTERKSHVARIIEILERDGQISRNQCLSMFPPITRLGARIDDLT
jgi:hypothetical protein